MQPQDRHVFSATIYRQGILRCVDVPPEVASAFAEWHYPPVVVVVGGKSRVTMLMPSPDGGLRLFLHDELRKAAQADTGDQVSIELRPDTDPELPMPEEIVAAAERIERGVEALWLLPPGLRREMLRFVLGAKSPETRSRRVARITELLTERAARLPAVAPSTTR